MSSQPNKQLENELSDALVVMTTTEREDQAQLLATLLIEQQLAACIQIIARMSSVYRWEGRVEAAPESLLIIKTTRAAYAAVEMAIKTMHRENGGYETPEVIAIPVANGSAEYLAWLSTSVNPKN